eukprot:660095-Pelagomonas_calceolata.AAC.4
MECIPHVFDDRLAKSGHSEQPGCFLLFLGPIVSSSFQLFLCQHPSTLIDQSCALTSCGQPGRQWTARGARRQCGVCDVHSAAPVQHALPTRLPQHAP